MARGVMEAIENVHVAMGDAWPGLEQQRIGDWVLRFGRGYTGRANSALVVGDPGVPLADAVAQADRAYRAHHLTPCFQVPLHVVLTNPPRASGEVNDVEGPVPGSTIDAGARPVRPELDGLLASLGYRWEKPTLVQTLTSPHLGSSGSPIDRPADLALDAPTGIEASWHDEPDIGWLSLASDRFREHPHARAVTMAHAARYLTLWAGNEPVGRGRVSVAGDWFDVSDLFVVPGLRGGGVGRWAVTEMTRQGHRLGAQKGILQVEADNVRAQTLYRSLGWEDVGGYHYRTWPGNDATLDGAR